MPIYAEKKLRLRTLLKHAKYSGKYVAMHIRIITLTRLTS